LRVRRAEWLTKTCGPAARENKDEMIKAESGNKAKRRARVSCCEKTTVIVLVIRGAPPALKFPAF
jgi:hypothetical protein